MPRAPNFTYRNPLEDIGPSLVRAILGDPAMAAAQRQQQSEMDLREAQAAMARSRGGLYDSQTTGVDQQNTAAQGMPGFFAKMYEAPPPMPSLDDPNFVQDAGPSAPLPTRDEIFRAGLPAFLGNAVVRQLSKTSRCAVRAVTTTSTREQRPTTQTTGPVFRCSIRV